MPIYEYRCQACGRKASIFFRSIARAEASPACPTCGEPALTRVMSRVWAHRKGSSDLAEYEQEDGIPFYGPDPFAGDDQYGGEVSSGGGEEGDILELAKEARAMAQAMGEPFDEGFDTALRQIEQGADPDDVFGELDANEPTQNDPISGSQN